MSMCIYDTYMYMYTHMYTHMYAYTYVYLLECMCIIVYMHVYNQYE